MGSARRPGAIRRTLEKILRQLDDLRELAGDRAVVALRAPQISSWSVAEQLEHLRRSDLTILNALASLDARSKAEGGPSPIGRLVLLLGFIPRGRGRAPGATQPLDFEISRLPEGLASVREGFAALGTEVEKLSRLKATIRHPALGYFTAAQMLTFAAIHHRHHEKIVRDILRAADRR